MIIAKTGVHTRRMLNWPIQHVVRWGAGIGGRWLGYNSFSLWGHVEQSGWFGVAQGQDVSADGELHSALSFTQDIHHFAVAQARNNHTVHLEYTQWGSGLFPKQQGFQNSQEVWWVVTSNTMSPTLSRPSCSATPPEQISFTLSMLPLVPPTKAKPRPPPSGFVNSTCMMQLCRDKENQRKKESENKNLEDSAAGKSDSVSVSLIPVQG